MNWEKIETATDEDGIAILKEAEKQKKKNKKKKTKKKADISSRISDAIKTKKAKPAEPKAKVEQKPKAEQNQAKQKAKEEKNPEPKTGKKVEKEKKEQKPKVEKKPAEPKPKKEKKPEPKPKEEPKAEEKVEKVEIEKKEPKPKKTKKEKKPSKHPRLRRLLIVLAGLFVAGMAAVIILFAVTAHSVGSINPKNIYANIEQTSYLYDVHGTQIDSLHYNEDRKVISIEQMPDDLKNAFIAIEDKTFYEHHGFNFKRMIGAILHSFTSDEQISGTSTITQQLARNVYLADIKGQRSIRRKITEMYIAWRIEKALTKEQILEAYLNTIYLGYGNYGVDAAAKSYFSKEVGQLDLVECAALAALPQAPDTYALISNEKGESCKAIPESQVTRVTEEPQEEETQQTYDPYTGTWTEEESQEPQMSGMYANDFSKSRRDLVIDLMQEQGFISSDKASASKKDLIDFIHPRITDTSSSIYTYFTDYVSEQVQKDLVEQYDMTEEEAQQMIYTGGIKINTTLDSEVQNIVCSEFEDDYNFPGTVDGSEVQASMVITEVGTGYITAMAGGRNTSGAKLFNRALNPRQPGSSIKPLSVYGAALQKSFDYAREKKRFPFTEYYGMDRQGTRYWGDYITAGSVVIDEPLTFNGERWPENVTRRFSGWNTFRTALQQSINTCAVKILLQVGTDYSIDLLERFGITTLVTDVKNPVNDVNPAALALGAMTYGVTPLEMAMAYASFPNGGVLNTPVCYTQVFDRKGKSILIGQSQRKQVMDPGVAWIMTDLLKSNVSRGIAKPAYIWGTEVGGKTGTTNDRYDVWFDGFTPRYAGALWIGTDLNVEMTSGSWTASRLWSEIMKQIPDIQEGKYPEKPANVVEYRGEYYTFGTEPNSSRVFEEDDESQVTGDQADTTEF